jgi:hypothetical protein
MQPSTLSGIRVLDMTRLLPGGLCTLRSRSPRAGRTRAEWADLAANHDCCLTVISGSAPTLGQDNETVLGQVGVDFRELARLSESNVIGTTLIDG